MGKVRVGEIVSVLYSRILHILEGSPVFDTLASASLNMTENLDFTCDLAPPVNSLDSEPGSAEICSGLESTW